MNIRIPLFVFLVFGFASVALGAPNDIVPASVNSSGTVGKGASSSPSISGDGRYVVFQSSANNLVSDDANGASDIFIYDHQLNSIIRIENSGTGGNGASSAPAISNDGSLVAFESASTNFDSNDTNAATDIFLYDRSSGSITRVSVSSDEAQANGSSSNPSLSSDGRFIAFESTASNLVDSDTNNASDIFVRDTQLGTTERVSISSSAVQADNASSAPSISGDGRYVAFQSDATNLVTGDGNGVSDIFVYDRTLDTIALVSQDSSSSIGNGASSSPSISSDGRYVAFASVSTNLISTDTNAGSDIFLRDTQGGTTSRVSIATDGTQGNGQSFDPAISADASFIIFTSDSTNLVSDDSNNSRNDGVLDVFIYKVSTAETSRINLTSSGVQANDTSNGTSADSDGTVFAFGSTATNLYSRDNNSEFDIFVVDTQCSTDTDADSTLNCSDGCPFDSTKIAAGTCGCGVADTDTDSDGTADCDDDCPSDSGKTAPGTCGCGASDADANGNGVLDCNDPTAQTIPRRVSVRANSRRTTVRIPAEFVGVTYNITVKKKGQTVASKSSTKTNVAFRLAKGTYRVTYTITLGSVTTQSSSATKIVVK